MRVRVRVAVALEPAAHLRALGVPEDEAASRVLLDGEEVEVLADLAVVAPLRLLVRVRVRVG